MQQVSELLKGKNRTDKVKKASGTSRDPDEEVEHASERATGKPNALLVDCGATTHIINDKSKFNKFDDNLARQNNTLS